MKKPNRNPREDRGSIVIFILFMLVVLASIPFAYRLASLSRKETNKVMSKDQSRDIARGGILDAIHWFRRQTIQPVAQTSAPSSIPYPDAAFNPDTSTNPSGGTIDPIVGLVKEYEFDPEKSIWARHEVRRQSVDNSITPSLTNPKAAHDISALRSPGASAGQGRAWSLVSRGIVFQRISSFTPFDQPPNRILSESFAYSEIKNLSISPSVTSRNAMIVTPNANTVIPKIYTTISGEFVAPAILTFNASGFNPNSASITGTVPVIETIPAFSITTEDLLGVSAQDLLVMSDLVIGTQMIPYPSTHFHTVDNASGDNALFYINGQLYSSQGGVNVYLRQGSGILFLDGPVHLSGQFRGLVIVNTGATLFLNGLTLGGTIFSNGSIQSEVDPSTGLHYKNDLAFNLTYVQEAINANNNYREIRSSFFLGADQ